VWRRANWMAGIVVALAVAIAAVLVGQPSRRTQGIVVPMPDTGEPTVTAVGVAGTTTTTSGSPIQPSVLTSSTPQQSSPANRQTTPVSGKTLVKTTTATTTTAPVARRFDPAASFRIVNVVNALSLDSGGWVQAGTPMKLWAPSPSTNLQFQLVETGGGYYRLTNRTNSLAVDGRGATVEGAYVGQRGWDSSPALQWLPTDIGDGLFTLTNRATGLVLDGGGPGVTYGAQAKQWPPTSSPNVLWRIVAA
jgi:hypothetical protein